MDYLLLIVGLGLLLLAANYLVDSSVAIAQRAKISNFIIGLTIVGIGTSAPELFVSVSSALSNVPNNGDIAMGNVLGSNIAKIFRSSSSCRYWSRPLPMIPWCPDLTVR